MKPRMQKPLVFYHNDADGIVSAGIVLTKYPDADCVRIDYGQEEKVLAGQNMEDRNVFVIDFCFKRDVFMDIIRKANNFVWIDHHKSAAEKLPDLWKNKSVAGPRKMGSAACELTWKYLYPTRNVPDIVEYTGDIDLWKFNLHGTKNIMEAFNIKITSPHNELLQELLKLSNSYANQKTSNAHYLALMQYGEVLQTAIQKRVEKNFKEGRDATFHGYKTRVINTNHDVSYTGNYAVKQGYELVLIWSMKENGVACGLYSADGIDSSRISMQYGGGGHPLASGFILNDLSELEGDLEWIKE